MKRIYYGNLTIDTTDEIADLLIELAFGAANSRHFRGQSLAGGRGFATQPYAVGRVDPTVIAGYVNGNTSETEVSLVVGVGISVAAEAIALNLPEPSTASIVVDGLRKQVALYADDE